MSAISTTLEKLSVGQTTAHNNMAWFPLLDAASPAADYLTLDEALNQGHARVTEVDEGGSVPELMFSNQSALRVLLLDGEELVGAKQNRVLNITILVGAGQKLTIPVSCVEEGRWGYRSRDFSSADRAMYARGRARKMSQVSASLRERGERHADQQDVWDGVASMARCLNVESPTEAMADAYEQSAGSLESFTDAFKPIEHQVGAVFCLGGKVAGIELFDSADTFARTAAKLVASYAMDALGEQAKTGEKSDDTPAPGKDKVAAFMAKLANSPTNPFEALGEGRDLRIEGAEIVGGALEVDGRLVHLSAFTRETSGDSLREQADELVSRIASMRQRRRMH